MSDRDRHTLNAVLTTVKRWEADSGYSDAEAMLDIARLLDQRTDSSESGDPS